METVMVKFLFKVSYALDSAIRDIVSVFWARPRSPAFAGRSCEALPWSPAFAGRFREASLLMVISEPKRIGRSPNTKKGRSRLGLSPAPSKQSDTAKHPFSVALGRAVAKRRAQLGLNLREVESRAGIAFSHISAIENGDGNPSWKSIWRLCQALEIGFVALITDAMCSDKEMPAKERREIEGAAMILDKVFRVEDFTK